MKNQHLAKPWGPKEFFMGSGYYTHNTEGYVFKPESLIIPSRPPPAERTVEDQPFLAHLWCAYAMPLCLLWIMRRAVGGVCVERN